MSNDLVVTIVGVGGIGSWLADGIAKMLEYKAPGSALVLIDGDTYEEKNKERQSFLNYGNKAEAKAAELVPQYHATTIIPVPKWVVADDAKVALSESDREADGSLPSGHIPASKVAQEGSVIFAVADNFKVRKQICDAAAQVDNIDVFLGGNDDGLFVSTYHYQRRGGVDITEHPAVRHDEYANPADRNPGELSCEQRAKIEGGTQLIAANMAATALLEGRFQHCILDGNPPTATEICLELGLGMARAYDRMIVSDSETQGV